jgi:hypothetical protein
MIQILLVICCVFACPLLMGGMMLVMGKDHQAAKLKREVRRLNCASARRRLAVAAASTLDEGGPRAAVSSADDPSSPVEESSAVSAG